MYKKGLDKNMLKEEEIQRMLKGTSEESLNKITKETEMLTNQAATNNMNINLQEVEDFLKEISAYKTTKITKKELK